MANPLANDISACAVCQRAVYAAHVDGEGRCVHCRPPVPPVPPVLPVLPATEAAVSAGTAIAEVEAEGGGRDH